MPLYINRWIVMVIIKRICTKTYDPDKFCEIKRNEYLDEHQIASVYYVSIHQISNFPSAFPLALSRAVSIASS